MKQHTYNTWGVIALLSGSIFFQACTVGLDPKVGYEPEVTEEPAAEEPAEEPAGEPSTETTPEDCNDGVDNDGDSLIDCADNDCFTSTDCLEDADGDGFYSTTDCDDGDASVYPGATEVANDGIDQDCNGQDYTSSGSNTSGGTTTGGGSQTGGTICNDTCTDGFGNFLYGANNGLCNDGGPNDFTALLAGSAGCALGSDCTDCGPATDMDGDGYAADPLGLAYFSDCDDNNPSINKGAPDDSVDGVDQNCDGVDGPADSGNSSGGSTTGGSTTGGSTSGGSTTSGGTTSGGTTGGSSSGGAAWTSPVGTCNDDCNTLFGAGGNTDCEDPLSPNYNAIIAECPAGTDCSDCGGELGGGSASGYIGASYCDETCSWSGDNTCDDGGPNSEFSLCDFGTDCQDCGSRYDGDENCDDGVDNDMDGATDCDDVDCSMLSNCP
jgi:hypothetical protein